MRHPDVHRERKKHRQRHNHDEESGEVHTKSVVGHGHLTTCDVLLPYARSRKALPTTSKVLPS